MTTPTEQDDRRTEVPIVSVTATGPVTKDDDGKGFSVIVMFTLADGRTLDDELGRTRKKDVLPAVGQADERAKAGNFSACFRGDRFIGTRTTFRIGGA